MSAIGIIKKANFKRGTPARVFAWLILLRISISSLPTFGQQSAKSSDLVFSPIQKIRVQKYVSPVKVKQPLDEICASDRQIRTILFRDVEENAASAFYSRFRPDRKTFFSIISKREKEHSPNFRRRKIFPNSSLPN